MDPEFKIDSKIDSELQYDFQTKISAIIKPKKEFKKSDFIIYTRNAKEKSRKNRYKNE